MVYNRTRMEEIRTTIRLPREVHAALRAIAVAESRTMGQQAAYFLRQAVEKHRTEAGGA